VFEDNALRLNKGPIVLLPNNSDEENRIDADMVNLTYYNNALEASEEHATATSRFPPLLSTRSCWL